MKKLIYNLLFVMSVMIVSFVGISRAEAYQATCSYTGEVKDVGTFGFYLQLDDKGKLSISTPSFEKNGCYPGDTYCEQRTQGYDKNVYNKISIKSSVDASIFQKYGDLITSCPEIYVTKVTKKRVHIGDFGFEQTFSTDTILYIGQSNSAAAAGEKNGEKKDGDDWKIVTEVSKTSKLALSVQSLKRKDKVYIDGKVINDKKPLSCSYNNDQGDKMTIKTVGGKVWIDSISLEPSTYNSTINNFKEQGDLTDKGCVLNLYANCGEEETGYHCTISKNKSGVFNRTFTSKRDLTENEDIQLITGDLTATDGCEMFLSLNSIIKEIFTFLQIAGVILVIVLGMLDFLKAVSLGEQDTLKKAFSKTVKRIIIVIILFILPVLIDWLLSFFDITETCLEVVE